MSVVTEVFSEKKGLSLSKNSDTSNWRELSEDVKETLQDSVNSCQYHHIALDKSTSVKETAQLAIFVRGISLFRVEIVAVKSSTAGKNVLYVFVYAT